MGGRRRRKEPYSKKPYGKSPLPEKRERVKEGHECPKRDGRITSDVCIVEQTRNGQSCGKCEQYRGSR